MSCVLLPRKSFPVLIRGYILRIVAFIAMCFICARLVDLSKRKLFSTLNKGSLCIEEGVVVVVAVVVVLANLVYTHLAPPSCYILRIVPGLCWFAAEHSTV